MSGSETIAVRRSAYDDGPGEALTRAIPVEAPVAIEINGIAYAVMMATPLDLEDFVTGFLLSEGLADVDEIGAIVVHEQGEEQWGRGYVARVSLPEARLAPIMERARRRLGDSSCGICGIESIEAALRPLPPIARRSRTTPQEIRAALDTMSGLQSLGRLTAATHAAAFSDGTSIKYIREDVGRHNALDKLIGACASDNINMKEGFIVVTSRCSYELVEKTVRAGCPLLVSISAPTDLAVRRARAAGLALAVLARDDTMLWASSGAMQAETSDGL